MVKRNPSHNQPSPNDHHLDDVMSWGKSKTNYYQQQQEEYSALSQQSQQAKQIYNNQYEGLNRDEFYQLPEQQEYSQQPDEQIDEQIQGINPQYIKQQILWSIKLVKLFSNLHDNYSPLRKQLHDYYLLILMSLKQFNFPHLDQHPLVANLHHLKHALTYFQKQYQQLIQNQGKNAYKDKEKKEHSSGNQQEEIQPMDDNSQLQNHNEFQQVPKSKHQKLKKTNKDYQLYFRLKAQKQNQKKQHKLQKKLSRQHCLSKQPFLTVKQNQTRLASEKILLNKGLMKRRRKDDGNSRTKLRHKYQKSLIKRRSLGFIGIKQNPGRFYSGENKVLQGRITSTKLK